MLVAREDSARTLAKTRRERPRRAMSPRSRRAAALLLPLAACVAGSLDLSGKGCDVNHPCVDGFTCAGGLCQPSGAAPLVDATLQAVPPDQFRGQFAPCQGNPDAHFSWSLVLCSLFLVIGTARFTPSRRPALPMFDP